jgi:hypothetical protein
VKNLLIMVIPFLLSPSARMTLEQRATGQMLLVNAAFVNWPQPGHITGVALWPNQHDRVGSLGHALPGSVCFLEPPSWAARGFEHQFAVLHMP